MLFRSFSWIVVPAIIYGSAPRNSLTRREAAKAFNFQLVAGFGFMTVAIVLGGILGFGAPVALAWLAWLGLTVFGGIKAATGEDACCRARRKGCQFYLCGQ